jgi:hypothetical protein
VLDANFRIEGAIPGFCDAICDALSLKSGHQLTEASMKQTRTPRHSPDSVSSSLVQQAASGAGQALPLLREHAPFSGKSLEKSGDRWLKMAGVNR